MKAIAAMACGLALAGCVSPYSYAPAPAPIFIAPPPLVTPYTEERPSYPPPAYVPPPEPEAAEPAPSDPATYESPSVLLQPMPDTVETPPAPAAPEPPRPAAALTEPPPSDTGGAVPLMGFRPMKGQKAPTP